jgi:hypothetical protein
MTEEVIRRVELGAETQHIIVREIGKSSRAKKARLFLDSIGFNYGSNFDGVERLGLESRGNKILLLSSIETSARLTFK